MAVSLPKEALKYFEELRDNNKEHFNILVIGEPGSGKTTLVENLLGVEAAEEQDEEPSALTPCHIKVQGVSVTVYEYGGFAEEHEEHQKIITELLTNGSISMTVYCFKMSETRLRRSLIDSFKMCNKIGVDWRNLVIALTFADSVPVPKSVRQEPSYDPGKYFSTRVEEWKKHIQNAFVSEVDLSKETACAVPMFPTCNACDDCLPTNEDWYQPLWLGILKAIHAIPHPTQVQLIQMKPPGFQLTKKLMIVGGIILFVVALLVGVGYAYVAPSWGRQGNFRGSLNRSRYEEEL